MYIDYVKGRAYINIAQLYSDSIPSNVQVPSHCLLAFDLVDNA